MSNVNIRRAVENIRSSASEESVGRRGAVNHVNVLRPPPSPPIGRAVERRGRSCYFRRRRRDAPAPSPAEPVRERALTAELVVGYRAKLSRHCRNSSRRCT